MSDLFYKAVIQTARTLWKFEGIDFQLTGFENSPLSGGAVMPVNHTGYMDFTFAGIPPYVVGKRMIRFMANSGAFSNKIAGPMLRAMKHISVDRDTHTVPGQINPAIAKGVEAAKAGELVGIFPEGHISRSFELADFKTGAARIALEANVPIVPIVIWGSQRIWTPGFPKRLGRHHFPVSIAVCPPLESKGTPAELTTQYKKVMQDTLLQLQATYPDCPAGAYWVPKRLGGSAPSPAEADSDYERLKASRVGKLKKE